jgi:DNA-binding CsgD family transcriptional regulator/tetratricopeptide (TPR) repeat protein
VTLLERNDLIATLEGLLDQARSAGSLALVAGEAGSGKTSLVREMATRVQDRAEILEGACDPLSTPRPLSPLVDFVRGPHAGLRGLLDGDPKKIEVFAGVLEWLKGRLRPVLMVVEDLHWADDATLDFLRYVGRRVGETNALVMCTFRDDELALHQPLRTVIGQLSPMDSTHRLQVNPLSTQAVATLAQGHPVDPEELYRLTGGNAFYVTEVLASGEAMPATVQDAVLARVDRLGDEARQIVEAVSIAPKSLDMEQANLLADTGSVGIDQAVGAGVLLAEGTVLRFRHELARAAVEGAIPPWRRLDLHRRMLKLLDEENTADLARLAHHAVRAGAADLVIRYGPPAAKEASRRGARKEAVAFYTAVLSHLEGRDDATVAKLRVEFAEELAIVGRTLDAHDQVSRAADHYRAANMAEHLALALVGISKTKWRLTDTPGARTAVDEAIELLTPLGPSRQLADALYFSSMLHMLARHHGPAIDVAQRSLAMAEEVGAEDVALRVRLEAGTIELVTGDSRRGTAILGDVKEDAERRGDAHTVSVALGMLGSGSGEARLYPEAMAALEENVLHGLATDEDYAVAYSRSWLARIAFEQGRWDESVDYAELVLGTSPTRTGIAVVTAAGALGRVRVRRGDPGGQELLEETVVLGVGHELQHVWSPVCGLAEHAWLTGRAGKIPEILGDTYRRALETDSPWAKGETGFWMWKAGAIDTLPGGTADPFAAQIAGDWRGSAEAWERIGCPYEVALALCDGDEEALLRAVSIFDSLGAPPAASFARERLRETGVVSVPRGPSRQTRANPAGLTGRQLEVLTLMASGQTNGEIAESLYISKKTVEHHVSAIFSKLGASTRAKAIATAAELGVIEK